MHELNVLERTRSHGCIRIGNVLGQVGRNGRFQAPGLGNVGSESLSSHRAKLISFSLR